MLVETVDSSYTQPLRFQSRVLHPSALTPAPLFNQRCCSTMQEQREDATPNNHPPSVHTVILKIQINGLHFPLVSRSFEKKNLLRQHGAISETLSYAEPGGRWCCDAAPPNGGFAHARLKEAASVKNKNLSGFICSEGRFKNERIRVHQKPLRQQNFV